MTLQGEGLLSKGQSEPNYAPGNVIRRTEQPESLGVGENTEREREKRLSTIDDRVGDERGG